MVADPAAGDSSSDEEAADLDPTLPEGWGDSVAKLKAPGVTDQLLSVYRQICQTHGDGALYLRPVQEVALRACGVGAAQPVPDVVVGVVDGGERAAVAVRDLGQAVGAVVAACRVNTVRQVS